MQEDYQKLNIFHSATVVMISIGIVLILSIGFISLPKKAQIQVSQAVQVMDIHDDLGDIEETVRFVFQTQERFMNEFYNAFVEVAALPDQLEFINKKIALAYESVGNFADLIVINNQTNINSAVLGTFIEINFNE
jgi:hypothetical protein